MPHFSYLARDFTGRQIRGTLAANSAREASAALAARQLYPVKVGPARSQVRRGQPRVRAQIVATLYGQIAALIRSGVPLLKAIDVVRKQSSSARLAEILDDVHATVEEGGSLADAMAAHPRVFGEMATSIVRAGGEGGFLEDALDRVARFTEQQDDLRSRVIGALAYPIFLAIVGTIIVAVLIVRIVPSFEGLFSRLREQGELPAVTDWLLWTSQQIRAWWWLAAVVGIGGFVVARRWAATPAGRRWIDGIRLRVPGAGGVYLDLAVARFCRVLGTLLKGGVPILRSLDISSQATANQVLADAIREAAENISGGESLAKPLSACGHFPATVVEMIAVAEESNTLETVLADVADTLERHTWRRLELFVRLLEPIMLLVLAAAVLVVVLALLLPVMKVGMTI